MLVPDLALMSHAIEDHLEEHRKMEPDPNKADASAKRVRLLLIKQVLKKAANYTEL